MGLLGLFSGRRKSKSIKNSENTGRQVKYMD